MRHLPLSRNIIRLYLWELESLPEYSASIPTGTTLWKQWRRRVRLGGVPVVVVGQYVPHWRPGTIGIRWSSVELRHGPRPRGCECPVQG